jgi:hypothetical protein
MKVKTLDGEEYEWQIPSRVVQGNNRISSALHKTAQAILRAKYPNITIYEEVPIKVASGGTRLYLDLYCPTLLLAVEVNGPQHYSFNSMFHKNKLDLYNAISNDGKKRKWCEINDIDLIVLKYNELNKWDTQL